MKTKVLFLCIVFSFLGCKSQKRKNVEFNNDNINFKYTRLYYKDSVIVESNIYDSKTGQYEYQEYNFGFGDDKKINTIIKFNKEDLKSIYQLYLSLNPKYLSECKYMNNKLLYKSMIVFETNIKQNNDCFNDVDENDEDKYLKIEALIYDLITKSPKYKKDFYWEFIKR